MSILQQGAGYISLYFISHYMGPEPLGIISAALAFSQIFLGFSDMGFGLAHIKQVSSGKDLSKCIGTYAIIKLFLVTTVGLVSLGVIFYLYHTEKKLPVPREYINVLYVMLVVSLIGAYTTIAQYTFAGRIEKAKEWSFIISNKFVTVLLRSLTAIIGLGAIYLAFSSLIGVIVGAIIAFLLLRRLPFGKFSYSLFKEYAKYALPAFIIGFAAKMGQYLDKVFIGIFANAEQVGFYSAAMSIVMLIMLINNIFIGLLLPTYSKLNAEGNIKAIGKFAYKIERYISIPLSAVGMFIFFFSNQIQTIMLGEEFIASSSIIKILIINSMVLILAQPYTAQLMGMDKLKLATGISFLILILNIIGFLIFIPKELFDLGAKGAAFSLLISTLFGTILFRITAFRLTKSKPNYLVLLYVGVGFVVFGTMSYFIQYLSHINNIFVLILISIIGFCVYLVILFLLKQFKKEDIIFYFDILNLKKLKNYVKTEMKDK